MAMSITCDMDGGNVDGGGTVPTMYHFPSEVPSLLVVFKFKKEGGNKTQYCVFFLCLSSFLLGAQDNLGVEYFLLNYANTTFLIF